MSDQEALVIYKVVINHQEQLFIGQTDRAITAKWRDGGFTETKANCLAFVKEQWNDMRPLSLRQMHSASPEMRHEYLRP